MLYHHVFRHIKHIENPWEELCVVQRAAQHLRKKVIEMLYQLLGCLATKKLPSNPIPFGK
jgi:hypothetical protein